MTPEIERTAGLSRRAMDSSSVTVFGRLNWTSKDDLHGTRIQLGGKGFLVSGIAPQPLEGIYEDRPIDLWMRLRDEPLESKVRNLWVLGRLRPGVLRTRIEDAVPGTHVNSYTGKTPEMMDGLLRYGALLRFAAGLVFFIACANVASLLLGRAAARAVHEDVYSCRSRR